MKWDFGDRRQSCAGNQEVNSVRVSRNDEQRQQQSGNFKLVTQRFVSTFSRRATKRQTFRFDPISPFSPFLHSILPQPIRVPTPLPNNSPFGQNFSTAGQSPSPLPSASVTPTPTPAPTPAQLL